MPRPIDLAQLQEMHAETTGKVWAFAAKIEHADLPAPLRYVVAYDPYTVLGEVYTPFAFSFSLPNQEEFGLQPARLELDAIAQSGEVVAALSTLGSAAEFTLFLVDLEDVTGTPILTFPGLELRRLRGSLQFLEADLAPHEDFSIEPYPGVLVTPATVPGSFGVGENA